LPPRTVSYRWIACAAAVAVLLVFAGCGQDLDDHAHPATQRVHPQLVDMTVSRLAAAPPLGVSYHVPALLDMHNVYAADQGLSRVVKHYRRLVYVPDSATDSVDEVDQRTYRVVRQFQVGAVPQHVVPSYDLRTLWVTNDVGNSLTPINPATGNPGPAVPVDDPYNLYFTPDGRYAMVMAEQLRRIDFRDPHTMALRHVLRVPGCAGVNHADFTADGHFMLVSCEFAAKMIVVDIPSQRVVRTLTLPANSSAQDVKLAPDGRVFYVADLNRGGVWEISADRFRVIGFIPTGSGAHGLYPSRNATHLFVSNRSAGTISVISFSTRHVVATWHIPGGGSPDMGGVSINGRVLWLAGRYNAALYAINTRTGKLIKQIPVGLGPHGACVYPQPGRYSLGHTGVMR
jgi:DNA-binding beta-propeller fold protein YncE